MERNKSFRFGFVLLIGIIFGLLYDWSNQFALFFVSVQHLAMKPGGSALNPHAAAYVPLSKREGASASASAKPAAASTHHVQYQPYGAYGYGDQSSQMYMPKTTYSSDKQLRDEDLEMDMEIEYLSATFSDLSYESISDVYLANNGDLDATIEMLNQLEVIHSLLTLHHPCNSKVCEF